MLDSKDLIEVTDAGGRKQKRALKTRLELVQSARAVFSRDGFEHARIEEIAVLAGKTRGAFYANFDDKEDVFCAIFEENLSSDMEHLGPLLSALASQEQRIHALTDYLVSLSHNRERTLLNLEFKLFAIRHPHRQKRMADLYTSMCMCSCVPELTALLQQLGKPGLALRATDSLAISGILDGLALNHLFNPELLCADEVARYMQLCLREMVSGETNV
jgi:AcrR family transcriptional regulator